MKGKGQKSKTRKGIPYIGDTVKFKKAVQNDWESAQHNRNIGRIGKVIGFDGRELRVQFDEGEPRRFSAKAKNLTLLKESEVRYPRIGDKIQILRCSQIADIGEIATVKSHADCFRVSVSEERNVFIPLTEDACSILESRGEVLAQPLPVDPRTFFKILRLDGTPPNSDAFKTTFRYALPTCLDAYRGRRCCFTEAWTPVIPEEKLEMCASGYHILDSGSHIAAWLHDYQSLDVIVCECRARGKIIGSSEHDHKLVAQSIVITKVLYRWEDVRGKFAQKEEVLRQKFNTDMEDLKDILRLSPSRWDSSAKA